MAPTAPKNRIHARTIPSSGDSLPVIGCGTWENFDVGADKVQTRQLLEVFRNLFSAGGSFVDSSPMYGQAERVVGELLRDGNWQAKAFIATKVWTQGREAGLGQMRQSLELLGRVDLMQVHNLVDWRTHLPTLREWKAQGRVRYIGVTHYTARAYGELENVMRREELDFVQLNYSLEERTAEKRLLPLAAERGVAVIVNLPFGAGRLLRSLRNRQIPAWAHDYGCNNWAQILLKFVLTHPAVTCVIPGTGNPEHMIENCHAGTGKLLDSRHADELRQFWDAKCA